MKRYEIALDIRGSSETMITVDTLASACEYFSKYLKHKPNGTRITLLEVEYEVTHTFVLLEG